MSYFMINNLMRITQVVLIFFLLNFLSLRQSLIINLIQV